MNSRNSFFCELPELNSERLCLRKIFLSDADDIFEYASVEKVTKYLSWNPHETINDTKQFICIVTQNYMDGTPSSWAIYHKTDQKVIGTIGFVSYEADHKRGEIGFALSEKYWNKGITSEALKMVLDIGFNTLGLIRIEARCYPENIASETVLKKKGFQYEGTLRSQVIVNNQPIDLKMFSLLKEEYKKDR